MHSTRQSRGGRAAATGFGVRRSILEPYHYAKMRRLEEKGLPAYIPNPHQGCLWRSHFVHMPTGPGALIWIRGQKLAVRAFCSPRGAANIYTIDANDTKAGDLVVKSERFLRVGAHSEYVRNPRLFGGLTRCLRQRSCWTNTPGFASTSYSLTRSLSQG